MPGYESLLRDDMDFPVELFVQDTDAGFERTEQHWHDCFELLYIQDGEAMQWVNGRSFLMRRGDLLLLRSGDIHATSRCRGPVRILVLKFTPGVLNARHVQSFQSPFLTGYLLREQYGGRIGNFGGIDTDAVCRLDPAVMTEYPRGARQMRGARRICVRLGKFHPRLCR